MLPERPLERRESTRRLVNVPMVLAGIFPTSLAPGRRSDIMEVLVVSHVTPRQVQTKAVEFHE